MKSINTESDYTAGEVTPSWCLTGRSYSRGWAFGNEGAIAKLKCHFQELVIGVNNEYKLSGWGLLAVRNQSERVYSYESSCLTIGYGKQ